MSGGRASKKKIDLTERRQMALDLRKAGHSYQAIADLIRPKLGERARYSKSMAWRDVQAAFEEIREEMAEEAADVLRLELERLDTLTVAWWGKAVGLPLGLGTAAQLLLEGDEGEGDPDLTELMNLDPDKDAARIILEVMKRRAKLLGLDKENVHLHTPRPLAMASVDLTGKDEEEIDDIIRNLEAALGGGIGRKTAPPGEEEE